MAAELTDDEIARLYQNRSNLDYMYPEPNPADTPYYIDIKGQFKFKRKEHMKLFGKWLRERETIDDIREKLAEIEQAVPDSQCRLHPGNKAMSKENLIAFVVDRVVKLKYIGYWPLRGEQQDTQWRLFRLGTLGEKFVNDMVRYLKNKMKRFLYDDDEVEEAKIAKRQNKQIISNRSSFRIKRTKWDKRLEIAARKEERSWGKEGLKRKRKRNEPEPAKPIETKSPRPIVDVLVKDACKQQRAKRLKRTRQDKAVVEDNDNDNTLMIIDDNIQWDESDDVRIYSCIECNKIEYDTPKKMLPICTKVKSGVQNEYGDKMEMLTIQWIHANHYVGKKTCIGCNSEKANTTECPDCKAILCEICATIWCQGGGKYCLLRN